MESESNWLGSLWPWLTLSVGMLGGFMRMNFGILNGRVFWWTSTMLFWFSLGVLIPDALHPSLWWMGPVITTALGVIILSFHEIRYWLDRMRKNMLRRVARRRKRQ